MVHSERLQKTHYTNTHKNTRQTATHSSMTRRREDVEDVIGLQKRRQPYTEAELMSILGPINHGRDSDE